jgi:hypothetical protein
VLEGINSQIYRYLHNRGIVSKVFTGIQDYDNRLVKTLAVYSDERVGETVKLMTELWHIEPGLPYYPLVHELGEMEFGRIFWEGQRDHLVHQLLVYLLGLYLYYGSKYLREALSAEFPKETDFLRAWKIAALFHDLGYVFEVEAAKSAEVYTRVCGELNKLLDRCLYYYSVGRGIFVLKTEDDKIRAQGRIYVPQVDPNDIGTLSRFGPEDLFVPLERQAQKAHLGEAEDNLRQYWDYAMTSNKGKRPGYVDHGIAGALVLLQQYRSLQYYVEQAGPVILASPTLVTKKTTQLVTDLAKQIAECQPAIEAAASGIALHYIDVDNWDHEHAFSTKRLTLHQFCLSLRETPFAFFLALTDALQSWDRPQYTMPRGPSYVMQAQDLTMGFREDKIAIAYETDPLRGTTQSVFARTLQQMSHYMCADDLEALLEEDTST